MDNHLQTATFAGGCFWCTEAIFKRLKGVESVMSGYSGGKRENPTYDQVHSGTGHAESVQVQFDPQIISYDKLLDVFFATHNPTTLNRQDYDTGEEYRSVIFYHDEEQKEKAEAKMKQLEKDGVYDDPIVTELVPYVAFYKAEDEHQNFYDTHRSAPYCMLITDPKIRKLMKNFKEDVKEEYK
jgi:peptide-methionine (S)-S-oxide reductase